MGKLIKIIFTFFGIIFTIVVAVSALSNFNYTEYNIHVNKSERVCSGQEYCRYLVFTDKGVFENTDTIWHLKFDSSDMYNNLVAGKDYNVVAVGWRIPVLSVYKNIIEIKE